MTAEVSWQVELAVKPGKLDDFRALTHDMVESTRAEPGALIFERYISDDGNTVYVYERYANSSAAVSHLVLFAEKYGERFASMVERKQFLVFGRPSDALKSLLTQFGATAYFAHFDGFSIGAHGNHE